VDARLRISRLSRIVDLRRYKIVLDDGEVGTVARGESLEMEVTPGAHTLELSCSPRRKSPPATFSIVAGETAAFACSPPSILAALPRLVTSVLLRRGFWIDLDLPGVRKRAATRHPRSTAPSKTAL
jgi:hypothetical protein